MKTFTHNYALKKKNSEGLQEGVLIKVVEDSFWGVSDLCPWPALGDLTWQEEIKNKGVLFQRAVELAKEDLVARKNKVSLLQNKFVKNNYLATDYKTYDFSQLKKGSLVKIKGTQEIGSLIEKLNSLVNQGLRYRIDFNCRLKSVEFETFYKNLNPLLQDQIQYIEDPTHFSQKNWPQWNQLIPLALDFNKDNFQEHTNCYTYLICKITREKPPEDLLKCIFTSSMDHPVGVAHALRFAQQLAARESGLLTLDLYEETSFHKYFLQKENELNFSPAALNDFGIGMTADLEKLNWKICEFE